MIRKEEEWVSDDITFCIRKECNIRECMRHPSHIRTPRYPHSYSDFAGTEYCGLENDASVTTEAVSHV